MRKLFLAALAQLLIVWAFASIVSATPPISCDDSALCPDISNGPGYEGKYVGHDEPALIFYSNTPGSGNSSSYLLTLPVEPPTPPVSGGIYSFQLNDAFWFGMALCDNQSAPEFTHAACVPDSDANIHDGTNPSSSDYIGRQPGGAYMELQFYPPGGYFECDTEHWCVAMNIFSYSADLTTSTDVFNNDNCRSRANDEYLNFAYVTLDGKPTGPVDPLNNQNSRNSISNVLLMNPGDEIGVTMNDTSAGFQVRLTDYTTKQSGTMTASITNGFSQLLFDPSAESCTESPFAFHPMFATSSEHTRLSWTSHTYNVAFADEIGHWEFPDSDNEQYDDDVDCFTSFGVTGCASLANGDLDFDGVSYGDNWPGTIAEPEDSQIHPSPIQFTSPLFIPSKGLGLGNYNRVAFETNLPRSEAFGVSPQCDRMTGANCTDPPASAGFYPIYSADSNLFSCEWRIGGTEIPGTTNTFGGTATAEYGPLLSVFYSDTGAMYEDFRSVLSNNPCAVRIIANPLPPTSPLIPPIIGLIVTPTLEQKVTQIEEDAIFSVLIAEQDAAGLINLPILSTIIGGGTAGGVFGG